VSEEQAIAPKTGRPTAYSEEVATKIFLLLSEGVSLKKIYSMADMPCKSTMFNWMGTKGHPFLEIVTRGRIIGRMAIADIIQENSLKLSENAEYEIAEDEEGNLKPVPKDVEIDHRKIDVANRGLKIYLDVTAPKKDWGEEEDEAAVLEVPAVCETDEEMEALEQQELKLIAARRKVKNLAQDKK